MPELPEVEYTARQLRETVVGKTIKEAEVYWNRSIGHPDPYTFRTEIAGRSIEGVRRRGKYLLIDLSGKRLLTIHRRMTGNLLLIENGWEIDISSREQNRTVWDTKGPAIRRIGEDAGSKETDYCRVSFTFTSGERLLYTDPRKFGRIELWSSELESEALEGLGVEPLSAEFTTEMFAAALGKRRIGIKQALLDQSIVAGVGNIYADEALYYAQIHPLRRTDSLTESEIQKIREAVITVLRTAIEHGGTSFNDYRDLWGEAGDNYNHVSVYHQTGEACKRCGTAIARIIVAQRSTHYCPGCQQLTEA